MSALNERGSTWAWRKIRARIIERDRGLCQLCGNEGNHVDHIQERSQGGGDEDDNLRLLCRNCNLGRKGRVFSVAPTPLTHHGGYTPQNASISHE